MNVVKKKLRHLKRKLGFCNDDMSEIEKMYKGEFFNPNDSAYLKLLNISNKLCDEFNFSMDALNDNSTFKDYLKIRHNDKKIINKLFPFKFVLSGVGKNLKVFIGQVDFLGCGFINRSCSFSKYSLVRCKNYTMFANLINVGNDDFETNNGLIKLGKINIGHDCWICAGAKINNNVSIGNCSVIGAGASVSSNVPNNSLAIGSPNAQFKTIGPIKNKTNKEKLHDDDEIEEIKQFIRNLKIKGNLKEYLKLYNGNDHNTANPTISKLYKYTYFLCEMYNSKNTSEKKKQEVLDILFYKHGKNLKVGKNLFVDMLGLTLVGDNVTIGDNVCISGNVTIGDNVKIGNNVSMFATGHNLNGKKRRVGFSLTKGIYEITNTAKINIESNVSVGSDCIIVPKANVTNNIADNKIVTSTKIISRN